NVGPFLRLHRTVSRCPAPNSSVSVVISALRLQPASVEDQVSISLCADLTTGRPAATSITSKVPFARLYSTRTRSLPMRGFADEAWDGVAAQKIIAPTSSERERTAASLCLLAMEDARLTRHLQEAPGRVHHSNSDCQPCRTSCGATLPDAGSRVI